LVVLEFELKAWHLLGRCSTTWAMPPVLFCFSYFAERFSHFCLGHPHTHNPSTSIQYLGFYVWATAPSSCLFLMLSSLPPILPLSLDSNNQLPLLKMFPPSYPVIQTLVILLSSCLHVKFFH
jgi:hypothetical protein